MPKLSVGRWDVGPPKSKPGHKGPIDRAHGGGEPTPPWLTRHPILEAGNLRNWSGLPAPAKVSHVTLRYAYNTNGCIHHRLGDAVAIMADAGFDGVSITLDTHHLDPFTGDWTVKCRQTAAMLRERDLASVIETGACYLLDPRRKHEPTLLSAEAEGRERRLDFLFRALELAVETGAETVSFWSGNVPFGTPPGEAMTRLRAGVDAFLARAEALGVVVSMEPEPGMLIGTASEFFDFSRDYPSLRLALDVGHCAVSADVTPENAIFAGGDRLGTVHLEDIRGRTHEHLPIGDGDMDIPAILAALTSIGYDRLVCLELSRDSHRAAEMIPHTRNALRGIDSVGVFHHAA